MKMMSSELWQELENDGTQALGLTMRRCPTSVLPDIFLGIEVPYNYRCLAVSLPVEQIPRLESLPHFREIEVETVDVGALPGHRFLVLKLVASELTDVFAILCDDLIASVAEYSNPSIVVSEITTRLTLWSELFREATLDGLSGEAQAGLYGELCFIRMALDSEVDQQRLLSSWTGPTPNIRDFQYQNSALEVKTTRGNNHQRIFISSERQLDPSLLEYLYLCHISLEVLPNGGENLNDLVDTIAHRFNENLRPRFSSLLISAGYFERHRSFYETDGYAVRASALFEVKGDFPRIEEKELRSGVGNVKYSVLTAGCDGYQIDLDTALQNLKLL
jgi:hypothetical protein